ncbi:TIGR04442 family protein [uncultured Desulfuromonas sp.]|uniref:TIGR04442 family protein n=1 Tax=uncultured Desulfuromonas sp. TaxID=181013 RepID=UPI002AAB2DED|nr:TIGR04442 family protein [uncultured Desulfuromonas sp.]
MHQELRLHGHIDDSIEYYVTVAAHQAEGCHFYERDDEELRIFSPGNEVRLDRTGLRHWGNGGTFCEYMYGIDQPLPDLLKREVKNRLVMYGASYRDNGELEFSDDTSERIPYDTIFEEGHAISNCFFFVTGSIYGALKTQQEGLLCLLGKVLKRTPYVAANDDARLVDELFGLLGHKSHFYLIRLLNKKHQAYAELFRNLYFKYRTIPDEEYENLTVLAQRLGISERQQKRIRIAVMYAHRDNRMVVDEYRDILVDCHLRGTISRQENARLTRLKTLATRNKIPPALFDPLEENLKYDKLVDQEQDYIAETREILSGLLLNRLRLDQAITRDDMVRLLEAKRLAMNNRDYLFDQILLETSKACDEMVFAGADVASVEKLSSIIDYFEHYERSVTEINNLAFMVGVRIEEPILRGLLRSCKALDRLEQGLFERLLFKDLLSNKFLGFYGRRKVLILRQALRQGWSVDAMINALQNISRDEDLYGRLLGLVKEQLRIKYARAVTWKDRSALRDEVAAILACRDGEETPFPEQIFYDVMVNVEKEFFYLQELLPRIIRNSDIELREDFLINSGLDRFYIEELESSYLLRHGLDERVLAEVRKGTDGRN